MQYIYTACNIFLTHFFFNDVTFHIGDDILQAEKGRVVIEYHEKLTTLLSNSAIYENLRRNPKCL